MELNSLELPGPIVESDWLADRLDDVVLADVRWSIDRGPHERDFLAGHIPGAIFVNLDTDLSSPPGPAGRHPLPTASDFAATRGRLGLDGQRPVVAYDDRSGAVASRLWWMLDVVGVAVAVLNGGIATWKGELSSGPQAPTPSRVERVSWPNDRFIEADDLESAIAKGAIVLDARSADRFRGEPNAVDSRPGHIPGTMSRPWTDNLDNDGRFRDPDQLRTELESLGVGSPRELLATCGSGVTACHDLLASRVAGFSGGRLYVGSWSEWGADPSRPVATGA